MLISTVGGYLLFEIWGIVLMKKFLFNALSFMKKDEAVKKNPRTYFPQVEDIWLSISGQRKFPRGFC